MLTFVERYGSNDFSQNGEDGIIAECCRRMRIANGWCVEIGANDGKWMSNTARLITYGFTGLMIEADPKLAKKCQETWGDNPKVTTICAEVSPSNVNALITRDVEVFSTDTDGGDYAIFKALKTKPRIAIVEIDSSIPPNQFKFNNDGGAGYWPMLELGLEKGYFLLCHTGNMVFVRTRDKRLFPEVVGNGLNADVYFNKSWLE